MSDKTLRAGLIRLAHTHPEFRKDLLPLLKSACGPEIEAPMPPRYQVEAPMQGKFEEGKPADPTKNMSPEDVAEWKKNTEKYKDKFKAAAGDPANWPKALETYVEDNPLSMGDSWDIVKMSGDEFKVECRESVMFFHAKTYYVGEALVSVSGKDKRGKAFKRQFYVDGKLVGSLIRLLNSTKPAGGRAAAAGDKFFKSALRDPKELESFREVAKLPKPLTLTDEGDENIYFKDGDDKPYVIKVVGHPDAAKIRKLMKTSSESKEASKKTAARMAVRRNTTIIVNVLTVKPDESGTGKYITGQMSLDFGGSSEGLAAVRFAALVAADGMGSWVVKSFTTQKSVSGGGAEALLGVLKSALQEALTLKGEDLFGPSF